MYINLSFQKDAQNMNLFNMFINNYYFICVIRLFLFILYMSDVKDQSLNYFYDNRNADYNAGKLGR